MTSTDVSGSLSRQGRVAPAGSPAAVLEESRRSARREHSYRPVRALAGGLVVIAAIVAALAVYSSRGDRAKVLAVTRTVLAGETLTSADLQVVAVSSVDDVEAVGASERPAVVGSVARVRLPAGSLVVAGALQRVPLRDPSAAAVSVEVPAALVPVGLRERSRVALVVWPATSGSTAAAPIVIEGVVTAIPSDLVALLGPDAAGTTMVALGVEVPPDAVTVIGAAGSISVGVLDPNAPGLVDTEVAS